MSDEGVAGLPAPVLRLEHIHSQAEENTVAYESEHSKKVKALITAILEAHGVTDEPTEADIERVEDYSDEMMY